MSNHRTAKKKGAGRYGTCTGAFASFRSVNPYRAVDSRFAGGLTLSPRAKEIWYSSNVTTEQDAGGAREHPMKPVNQAAKTQTSILESMTYVFGMNYAKHRLEEAIRPKVFGKHKQVRAPTMWGM